MWVLENTKCNNSDCQTVVAKVEGFQLILTGTKRFPTDPGVIGNGFGALGNIVSDQEANADLLVTQLDIPFLIKRMKEFKADADVTQKACYLVENPSDFERPRNPINDAKAFTALGAAIESHKNPPDIKTASREAMKNLM